MKILVLSTYDVRGGAARAAFRHCQELISRGHDVKMLVQFKDSGAEFVSVPQSPSYKIFPKIRSYADLLPPFLKSGRKVLFSSAKIKSRKVTETVRDFDPDIVHIHWINKGFVELESIPQFNKPVVWTMHDMWAFTGGCHLSDSCIKYREECGACPMLASGSMDDMSRMNYMRKRKVYEDLKSNLIFTTPSSWMKELAESGSLLTGHMVEVVPNGLNTGFFKPLEVLKEDLPIEMKKDARLVIFGALRSTHLKVKGYDLLLEAIKMIETENVEMVVFGGEKKEVESIAGVRIHHIGYLEDEKEIVKWYNAADLTVVPSRFESFGQVATESMACATPVVAFDHAGVRDIIDHQENGYLARPYSIQDFAMGIDWVLTHPDYASLCEHAKNKITGKFTGEKVCMAFEKIYDRLV